MLAQFPERLVSYSSSYSVDDAESLGQWLQRRDKPVPDSDCFHRQRYGLDKSCVGVITYVSESAAAVSVWVV